MESRWGLILVDNGYHWRAVGSKERSFSHLASYMPCPFYWLRAMPNDIVLSSKHSKKPHKVKPLWRTTVCKTTERETSSESTNLTATEPINDGRFDLCLF